MASKQAKNDAPEAKATTSPAETTIPAEQPPTEQPPLEPVTMVTAETDLLGETKPVIALEFKPVDESKLPPLQSTQAPASAASPANPQAPEDLSTPANEAATAGGWTCPKCLDKRYDYRSHLLRHIKRVHADEATAMEAALPASGTPGRKAGSKNAPAKPDFSDVINKTAESAVTDYQLMSSMMFDMTTGTMANIFGPEWLPRPDDPGNSMSGSKERDNMIMVIKSYLQSKQVKDIPPGMMLTIVAIAYSAPRLRAPATASKLKASYYWFKSKFARKARLTIK